MAQREHLYSLILTGVLIVCYAVTLAPGLTWANNGADGGDLITAAATHGIAHPSGYPLYLLLAQAFQSIPIGGALAFRANLLSAACAIGAALTLQALLKRQAYSANVAFVAALAFGLAPAVWAQAIIAEVYSLQNLLIIFFLFGLLDEKIPGGDWIRGLLFGLATSNHLTTLLLLPLLLVRFHPKLGLASLSELVKRGLACLCGLALYLTLPLRAASHPLINWGNPVTLEGFWWLVSGQLYASYPFNISFADILLRFRAAVGLLLEQYSLPGVLLGVYGLFSRLPRGLWLTSLWVFISSTTFAICYGSYDSQVYLLPVYLAFTLWMAHGLQDILRAFVARSPRLAQLTLILTIAGMLARIPFTLSNIDASHNERAEQFGAHFVADTPPNALVFASGDEAVFALWYFHHALGKRPDVAVIADDLLVYPWYVETLAHTYPSLIVSTSRPKIVADNPGRPTCYVSAQNTTPAQLCGANP